MKGDRLARVWPMAAVLVCWSAVGFAAGIEGTWAGQTAEGPLVVTFNPNGSLVMNGAPGSYRLAQGILYVTVNYQTIAYRVQLAGDRMVVSGGDLDAPLILSRRRAQAGAGGKKRANRIAFAVFQTPTLRFGYPQGWRVSPMQGGYAVTQYPPNVMGPGYIVLSGPAQFGMTNAGAVVNMIVQWLRMTNPTIRVDSYSQDSRAPGAMRVNLSYVYGYTPFVARAFADLRNGAYLFVSFYAPRSQAGAFDLDAMLQGAIDPIYGASSAAGASSAQAYWYAYLLQQQRLRAGGGFMDMYQTPWLGSQSAPGSQQAALLYMQLQRLQQMAWMWRAQGLPVPAWLQQQQAAVRQRLAALPRAQAGRAPAAGAAALQELQRMLVQAQQEMGSGRFVEAERLAKDVFQRASSLAAQPSVSLVLQCNAAQLLMTLYCQERAYDRFFEWARKFQALGDQAAPLLAQQSALSEAETRGLLRSNAAMMAAEMHLAMRELSKALSAAAAAEQAIADLRGSQAAPALRATLVRSRLFRAFVLARRGERAKALRVAELVEKDLPALGRIRFGDLLVGALAKPGVLERTPPDVRRQVQALVDAANGAGAPLVDLYARYWLCLVYFELSENQRAAGHAQIIERRLPEFQQRLQRFSQVVNRIAASVPSAKGLKLDLSNQFNLAPYHAVCAKAAFRLGRWERSERLYARILADANVRHQGDIFWDSAYHMGMLQERRGELERAKAYYEQAIDAIERTRSSIRSDMTKMSFVGGDRSAVYERLVKLLVRLGDAAGAFSYVERAKSRALVDLLAGRRVGRTASERSAAEAFARRFAGAASARADAPDDELASLLSVRTLSLSEVQRMLPAYVTLLEYYAADDRLFMWIVSRGRVTCKTVRVGRRRLSQLVWEYRRALTARGPARGMGGVRPRPAEGAALTADLFDILIEPARGYLRTREICVAPHGVLHYLPFAALRKKGRYLVEDAAVFRTPSATVLQYALRNARKPNASGLLVFGNPDLGDPKLNLRYAEEEAKRIAGLDARARAFTRAEATETLFKQNAGRPYAAVHFACHGVFDPESPLDSALLLARDARNDGRLTAAELFRLRLGAPLVTLSACQTGLAEITPGDDLVGLTRGFIFAGAGAVVASLWSVDDQATAALMEQFYRNMKRLPKAEALRRAQLAAMAKYPAPRYWAAFTLTGSPE